MNARGKSLSEIKAQIEADTHQNSADKSLKLFNADLASIRIYGTNKDGEYFSGDFLLDRLPLSLVNELKTFIEHLCHYHQNKAHTLQSIIEKNSPQAK